MTAPYRALQSMGPGVEFDTIRRLLAQWGDVAVDIGDDAAVLPDVHGAHRVVTTDACVEHVHFRREWIAPREIGSRAVAAALSDLAAMGARADALLLSLIVPDSWRDALAQIADGIADVTRMCGARIVGGNLSAGDTFSLTTTAIGSAPRVVPRSGALAGDVLMLTGILGGPAGAVSAWTEGREPTPWQRERFCRPIPRIPEGRLLAEGGARAMIDISDGLLADLRHLAVASDVVIELDVARIPCGPHVTADFALTSGEEYELLAVVPAEAVHTLFDSWPAFSDTPLTIVGKVVANTGETPTSYQALNRVQVRGRLHDGQSDHASSTHIESTAGHDHFSR